MKDMLLTVIGVSAIALAIGLAFHWVYPRVEITSELAGLFVFVAAGFKIVLSRLWAQRQGPRVPPASEADK